MADAVVGTLRALLTMDSAQFESGVRKAQDSLKVFSKDAQQMGRAATALGASLTKTLTLPILGMGAGLLKVGADFDKASDSIRAATGATGKSLDALNESFKKVLGTVPASMDATATAIGALSVRTGQTGAGLEALTTQLLNLSRVGNAEVGTLVASTTRAFGDWSIATGKQGEALDFLFKTTQSTGIGIGKLTDMVVQFGAPMRALGFEFEQAAALMGKWEKEGVNTETVLSGLRFALGNFAKAGVEPAKALRDVQAAILGAKTEAEATGIAFQVFGKRAAVDMGRAIVEGRFNIDGLVTSLKNSKESINAAAADTLSLSEKFLLLKNRVEIAVEPISNVLMKALEHLMGIVEPLLHGVAMLAQAFGALPGPVQGAAFGFAALLAAVGPMTWAFGQVTTSFGLVVGAFAKGGLAARGLTLAMGPLGAAVAVAGAAFASWQLGTWIGKVSGATDAIERLTARMMGIDPAVTKATIAARHAAEAAAQAGVGFTAATTGAATLEAGSGTLAPALGKAAAGLDFLGKKTKSVLQDFQESLGNLVPELNAAVTSGAAMAAIVEQFGKQAADAVLKAELIPGALAKTPKVVKDIADAWITAEVDKMLQGLHADTLKLADAWTTDLRKAAEDTAQALGKSLLSAVVATKKMEDDLVIAKKTGVDKQLAELQRHEDEELEAVKARVGVSQLWMDRETAAIKAKYADQRLLLNRYTGDVVRDAELRGHKLKRELDRELATERRVLADMLEARLTGNRQITDAAIRAQKERVEHAKEEAGEIKHAWLGVVDELTRSLEMMANIAGESFGGLIKGVGEVLASLKIAGVAIKTLRDDSASKSQKIAAGGVLVAQTVEGVQGFGAATDKKSAGDRALSGGMQGAKIGAIGGPYGAAAGFVVGAIVGALRKPEWATEMDEVGRDFGTAISEGLSRKITEDANTIFDDNRAAANIFNLDAIIGEAGGLTDDNVKKFQSKLRDVFSMVERGDFTANQARETLDKNFGAFAAHLAKSGKVASASFSELLQLNARFGTQSAEMAGFVTTQTSRLGSSLGSLFAPLTKNLGDVTALRDELKKLDKADPKNAERIKELNKLLAEATAKLAAAGESMGRFENLTLAAFNASVKAGSDYLSAMEGLGPALDQITAGHKEMGTTAGAAIQELLRMRELVATNSDLVSAAGSLNEVTLALSNIGGLTASTMADLQTQAKVTYGQLTAAGFTENQALQQMKGFLEQVRNAHVQLGLPIDANTERLIAQGEANGILGKQQMSTNDIMIEGLSAVIEALGGELPAAWKTMADKATAAVDGITDSVGDVTGALDDMADRIDGVTGAILNIPRNVDVQVNLEAVAARNLESAIASGDPTMIAAARNQVAANRHDRQSGSRAAVDAYLQTQAGRAQEVMAFLANNPDDYDRLSSALNFPVGGFIKAHEGRYLGAPRPGEINVTALTGESVLNRMATQRLGGEAGINAINRGDVASVTRGGDTTTYITMQPGAVVVNGAGKNADQLAQELAPKILRSIARHSPEGSRQLFKKMVNSVSKDAPSA